MSSGIILNEQGSWLVAGWVASAATSRIRTYLRPDADKPVLDRLQDVDLYPGSLADFTEASSVEVQRLYSAAVLACEAAESQGPSGWHTPELFPGYITRFKELVLLLASDGRIHDGTLER
jgi:hypothetical protein